MCEQNRLIAKWILKLWIIINKNHFVIFLDNCTHKNIKPRKSRQWGFSSTLTPAHLFDVRGWRKRNFQFSKIALGTRLASAKWMKVKSQTRLMSWYWEQKPSCRKDLIKCNGHPWIMLSFNWLVIIWRGRGKGGGGAFVGQGDGRILDVAGQGGWGVLKIDQFWWTSYVYCP